jgi:VWFA-related protein
LPWQAPAILDEIVRGAAVAAPPQSQSPPQPVQGQNETAVFRSDVRVVNLTAPVTDEEGRPIVGLAPEDFRVFENGIPQKIQHAAAEEVPFNLVLLFDLSGSTARDRDAMKQAAKRFVEMARPKDRVALYALANDKFHAISRLTQNRDSLKSMIDAIPAVSGGSPIYDMVVLGYAHELHALAWERNAIIFISDGVDNQIRGTGSPSEVNYKKLLRAASGFHALLYPIFLDPFDKFPAPDWARKARSQMEALARATGGRLFPAHSIRDLDGVYPLVAEELRSVYTLSYSPSNQDFNGAWRRIEVKVDRGGARVRTRGGYHAR